MTASKLYNGPVHPVVPLTAQITAPGFRMRSFIKALSYRMLTASSDYKRSECCNTRMLELRWCVPCLNSYLRRSGLVPCLLSLFCNEEETIRHFLLSCSRFTAPRKNILELPLRRLGLDLTEPVTVSFGAYKLWNSASGMFALVSRNILWDPTTCYCWNCIFLSLCVCVCFSNNDKTFFRLLLLSF